MIVAVNKLDTAVMAMNPSSAIYGSWNTLREPITSTWSAVKEPFVSAWDSLMGAGPSTAAGAGAEQAATGFMQVLTNKTAEWVGTTFGSGRNRHCLVTLVAQLEPMVSFRVVTLRWVALRARF